MKALAKLSLLLALVVAGRYLRPGAPAAFQNPEKTTTRLALPDSLRFVNYTVVQTPVAAPVSQNTSVSTSSVEQPASPTWY